MARNQTERIKRLHLGPVDLVGAPSGVTRRLFENRVTRTVARRIEQRRGVVPTTRRTTRDDLARAAAASPEAKAIVDRIEGLDWYHTIDLGHGVRTPGFVDHDHQLPYYGLPSSLAGKRCLDIATFDGYWAFEFERRGASEVVALDIPDKLELDCPRWMLREPENFDVVGELGQSFKVVHDVLDSRVKRVEKSVYELDPDIDGMFDVVFISDVLVHLRDPQLAIERAFSVCKGELYIADVYSPQLEAFGDTPVAQFTSPSETWWIPNVATLKRMMYVAGFDPITEVSRFVLDSLGHRNHKVVLKGTAAAEPAWAESQRRARRRMIENRKADRGT